LQDTSLVPLRTISRPSEGRADAELIYNGFWFSPKREILLARIDKSQENVQGVVARLKRKRSANGPV
jgi:argininosuccinate synthase